MPSRIAKPSDEASFDVVIPDHLSQIGCMVMHSKRFTGAGGWRYAQFDYDPARDSFAPDTSVLENNATCGAACHAIAEAKDFIFAAHGKR
jgi:hypothetical protein